MSNIYILGDSHTCYLNYKNVIEDDIYLKEKYYGIEFNFIARIAMSMYRMNYSEYGKIEDFEKNGIIMPAVGEFDVRFNLNRHNNADDLAKDYVLKTIKYFPENKIRFIEPMPEASDDITIKYFIDNPLPPDFPKIIHSFANLEDRVKQYHLLVKSLRKYSYQYGLLEPINLVDEVFKTDILTKEHAIGIHVNKEYAKKIIDLIVEKSFNLDLKEYNI
jgi:hypothetical protein